MASCRNWFPACATHGKTRTKQGTQPRTALTPPVPPDLHSNTASKSHRATRTASSKQPLNVSALTEFTALSRGAPTLCVRPVLHCCYPCSWFYTMLPPVPACPATSLLSAAVNTAVEVVIAASATAIQALRRKVVKTPIGAHNTCVNIFGGPRKNHSSDNRRAAYAGQAAQVSCHYGSAQLHLLAPFPTFSTAAGWRALSYTWVL